MNREDCETIRDFLPELDHGSLAPERVDMTTSHLGSCPACETELELIRALRNARPGPPPDLEARIQAKVREEMERESRVGAGKLSEEEANVIPISRRRRWAPGWALSAAAVVVLALGTGVILKQRDHDFIQDPILVASQEPLPEAWLWDDGMVAGAPVFDGLSDEDLEALLKEFEG